MRFIKKIEKKKKVSSDEINTDKQELLERMYNSLHDIICEVKNKMLKIIIDTLELYEKDMDKVNLINNKLKKS